MSSRAATICSASSAREQADLGQHAGVGLAGADVVAVEAAVEADRLGEGLDAVVGVAAEAAAPGFLTHGSLPTPFSRGSQNRDPARRGSANRG